jgi:tRNA(Arg) A34 adenosine deaminase TadA
MHDIRAIRDNAAAFDAALARRGLAPVSGEILALDEARRAAARGEVPVGAVIVRDGEVIAAAGNSPRALSDPTAHAEILAIRAAASRLGSERLIGCDLYVTLEPCTMCAAAISFARIRRLYFGAADPKGGAVENGVRFFASPACHHAPEVYGGLAEREAAAVLTDFFRARR